MPSSAPVASVPRESSFGPKEDLVRTDGWFFLDCAKKVCGPFSAGVLKEKWQQGQLLSDSWVWNELLVTWKKVSQVPVLLEWLRG
jgi:hypothetical protein